MQQKLVSGRVWGLFCRLMGWLLGDLGDVNIGPDVSRRCDCARLEQVSSRGREASTWRAARTTGATLCAKGLAGQATGPLVQLGLGAADRGS